MTQPIDPQFIDRLQEAFREGDMDAAGKTLEEAGNVRVIGAVFRIITSKDFDALHDLRQKVVTFQFVGSGGPMSARARRRLRVVEAARGNFAQVEDQRPETLSVVA